MTPTQLLKWKEEFFKEFGSLPDSRMVWDIDALPINVWQFIESKLKAIEEESIKGFVKYLQTKTNSKLEKNGMGYYRNQYLKSNKLEK